MMTVAKVNPLQKIRTTHLLLIKAVIVPIPISRDMSPCFETRTRMVSACLGCQQDAFCKLSSIPQCAVTPGAVCLGDDAPGRFGISNYFSM